MQFNLSVNVETGSESTRVAMALKTLLASSIPLLIADSDSFCDAASAIIGDSGTFEDFSITIS